MAIWRRWKSSSPVGKGTLTQEQYWVLKTLNEEGPMKVKDLATRIGCTSGSASVAVKRLEKAGLVTRQRNDDDERVVTVGLSKRGVDGLHKWKADQLDTMSALFENLEAGEREALRRLLSKALSKEADKTGDLTKRRPVH